MLDYIIISKEKRNVDLDPITVWCRREGGTSGHIGTQLAVRVAYTYAPDTTNHTVSMPSTLRLNRFIDAGKDKGIENIFSDIITEAIRSLAQGTDWEEFLHFENTITFKLIETFTGLSTAAGDPLAAIAKGEPDTRELGIILFRFNVKEIEIVDEELRKAVMATPKEDRERYAEEYEMDTELSLVDKLIKAAETSGKKLSVDEGYALIKRYRLIREGRLQGQHVSLEGLEGLASVLESIFGKKKTLV